MKVRGDEQDLIPHVGQLVLTNVLIEGWITDPYVHSLLDGADEGMLLPIYNGEIVQLSMTT